MILLLVFKLLYLFLLVLLLGKFQNGQELQPDIFEIFIIELSSLAGNPGAPIRSFLIVTWLISAVLDVRSFSCLSWRNRFLPPWRKIEMEGRKAFVKWVRGD